MISKISNKHLVLKLLIFFVGISLVACSSSTDKPSAPQKKTYSESIERDFRSIEADDIRELERLRAIERYERMRLEALENPEIIEQQRRELLQRERNQRRLQRQQRATSPSTQASQGPPSAQQLLPTELPQSTRIESQQNIDYFCIENERDTRWANIDECKEYGAEIFEDCEDQYLSQVNFNMVRCVRNNL